MPDQEHPHHLPHPHVQLPGVEAFVYEGEATPLLLRKSVVFALVAAFAVIAAGYFAAVAYFDIPTTLDAEPFQDWVEDRGALGPVVFILVMAVSVLFAPIPNVPIFIAAGLAWGVVLGTVYSMAGMMLGSTMAFYAARLVGRKHLARLIGRKTADRLDHLVDRFGGGLVFWARMLPVVNFDWISFLAGMTAIRFLPFFVYSFLGMLLPTIIAVVAGDSLGKDIRISVGLLGVWVSGIVFSAGFFWYRQRKGRATTTAAP
ncbi:MAG: TVP38/TMEM64 family protein [Dehalococcoidia bacterium]|nr:TVP38/TMEM64 family protein [Dehalococcoidia bacterium]